MDNIDNNKKTNKIAIMGGTFDPIHYGHLIVAETVRVQYNLDKVIFIPSGNPPHKDNSKVTHKEIRYLMVEMAVVNNPYFQVSRIEINRQGYTYTIDTIKKLKSSLGEDVEIYFITGADAILEILTWRDVSELLCLCKFVAVTRPGYDKKVLDNKIKELKALFNCDILTLDVPGFSISSTDIRNRVLRGYSIKYLVPENVERYILKNNLYRGSRV